MYDAASPGVYTLSLHDALPIFPVDEVANSTRTAFPAIDGTEIDHRRSLGNKRSALETAEPLRSEEHTSELQSQFHLVCRLLLENKKDRGTRSAGLSRPRGDGLC